MKNEKHQQAKNLYFQTNLSKSEIANRLGISRRTVMLWCQQGNWDRLRQSAENMPSMVAEKCYFLLDHYATHLLSSNAVISTFGPREANAINQMATSIKKLKNRSAINEAMEMFNFFLEYCKKQDPELVDIISPLIEGYIATRRDTNVDAFIPAGFTRDGHMDEKQREQQIIESWKDEDDQQLMEEEYFAFLKHHEEQKAQRNRTDDSADATGAVIPDLPKAPRPSPTAEKSTLGEPSRTMTPENSTTVEDSTDVIVSLSNDAPALRTDLSGPRRTMTAENSTKAEDTTIPQSTIVENSASAEAMACHPELVEGLSNDALALKTEPDAPLARRSFSEGGTLMKWPDIHTPPFGYPPYTTTANMNYHHPLLNEKFDIPSATSAQQIECHGEPRRTMTASPAVALAKEGQKSTYHEASTMSFACHPEPAEGDTDLVDVLDEPNKTIAEDSYCHGEHSRTMTAENTTSVEVSTITLGSPKDTILSQPKDKTQPNTNVILSLSKDDNGLTPLETFSLLTFLNATAPKKEPDTWSRFYKEYHKIFPDTIDTLEDLDEFKFPPERRETILNILRSGTPIPGWEKLQLKLLHEDAKNHENNNQNKAA